MSPGFVHFDIRLGLKSSMLNEALFGLLGDKECISQALLSLGFSQVEFSGCQAKALPPENFLGQDLQEIKELFKQKKVQVGISSLALEILDNLALEDLKLTKTQSIWLVCELASLCAQILKLEPKFITASKIHIGPIKEITGINNRSSINKALIGLPVIEIDEE